MFYLCSNNFYYFMLYHSSALEFIIERYISIVYYYYYLFTCILFVAEFPHITYNHLTNMYNCTCIGVLTFNIKLISLHHNLSTAIVYNTVYYVWPMNNGNSRYITC